MMSNDRPFVDSLNVHDVERIDIETHKEARCVSVILTGKDGVFSRFVINVWRNDHRELPTVHVTAQVHGEAA